MKNNYIAVDTNVLIYLHDSSDQRKREIAKNRLKKMQTMAAGIKKPSARRKG